MSEIAPVESDLEHQKPRNCMPSSDANLTLTIVTMAYSDNTFAFAFSC